MKEYKVTDLKKGLFADDIIVQANSPLDALKKVYPNKKFKRSGCTGEIIVGSFAQGRYYGGYRTYTYTEL